MSEQSDWIEWKGGAYNADPCPKGTRVEIKFRGGSGDIAPVEEWSWDHLGNGADIIAYRIVKP